MEYIPSKWPNLYLKFTQNSFFKIEIPQNSVNILLNAKKTLKSIKSADNTLKIVKIFAQNRQNWNR